MNLRKLKQQDAPFMLEWMHDEDVTRYMNRDFANMSLKDCQDFISQSQTDSPSIHRAITDDNDVYMGTVSLKNVNLEKNDAEFAIIVRKEAMGKGFAEYGMKEIIRRGFSEFGLDTIYWNVLKDNARAIRFYEKNGYELAGREGSYLGDCQKTSIPGLQSMQAGQTNTEIRFKAERNKTEDRRLSIPLCEDNVYKQQNGQIATNEGRI